MRSASFLVALLALSACGDDSTPTDAGPPPGDGPLVLDANADDDAGSDAGLPEGPAGDILAIPETERWTLPVDAPVQVVRTEANVPHIYASSEHDLRVVQGFVVARDRYFQIEAGRRLAQGRLSELLGDAALSGDQQARGQGMTEVVERTIAQMTDEQLEMLQAFTDGVNAYIQLVKDRRIEPPTEFQVAAPVLSVRLPGDLMEPYTVEDLIAFMGVPAYQLGYESRDPRFQEVQDSLEDLFTDGETNAELRRAGVVADVFEAVRPLSNAVSAPGFGFSEGGSSSFLPRGGRELVPRPTLPGVAREVRVESSMLRRWRERQDRFERRLFGERDEDFGSNGWAVMGEHTVDGAALLAGDGHLPLSIAPLFYQLGLDTTVFGDGDVTLMGLFFAGVPHMAVGTNGRIAWTQTYLRGDITDWYAEELVLDDAGMPMASRFQGGERDLVRVEEEYVIAERPGLGSVGRTETWPRFETFDGRVLAAIEGRLVGPDATPGEGESLVNVQGSYVIPGDVDDDGVVSAISFDFTGFDISNILRALGNFNEADTVYEFRDATRELVSYAQNLVAADIEGNAYYTSYNAMPCRAHLPRDEETGRWIEGADPRGLIDGTQYGGFRVPLDAGGMPDESVGAADPQSCLVPFDEWPSWANPDQGFVVNANNDIGNITTDGDFFDDPWYIGGPWNVGYRAATITSRLAELAGDSTASLEGMVSIQGDHRSVLGIDLGPYLLESIAEAQRIQTDGPADEGEQRILDLYEANEEAMDEVQTRLRAWLDAGAEAASGVETFYHSPSAEQRTHAVATAIFNQWYRELYDRVFEDEGIDDYFFPDGPNRLARLHFLMWEGRGDENPRDLASWDEDTGESVFFDVLGTDEVESSHEMGVVALADALAFLSEEPSDPGVGGYGSEDMDTWLWGLRHAVAFESIVTDFVGDDPAFSVLAAGFAIDTGRLPLAEDLAEDDPRAALPWFPRPGDLFCVDAAAYDARGGSDLFYDDGPVMRMVIRLEEGNVGGVNVIPGGQSGRTASPHFDDQAQLWLGNETTPLRFEVEDVIEGAVGREAYLPE